MKIIQLNEMIRYNVISSNIAAVGWEKNMLQVKFLSGGIYNYYNVPKSIYTKFLKAPSKGRYFWRVVRGRYRYKRIN